MATSITSGSAAYPPFTGRGEEGTTAYLQEAVDKISAFGKADAKESTKSEGKQEPERVEPMETTEVPEAPTPVPTGPGTEKSCEGIEDL